jgi:hypothetical protein
LREFLCLVQYMFQWQVVLAAYMATTAASARYYMQYC